MDVPNAPDSLGPDRRRSPARRSQPVRVQEDEEFRPLAVSLEGKEVELKELAGLNRSYAVEWN